MVERSHTAGWWPAVYEPLKRAGERVAEWFSPKSDAAMSENAYRVRLELPGVAPEDIEVSLHESTLIVKGEKRYEKEEIGESYFFSEREYGAFQRSFRLPPDADPASVDAHFRDGVLTVSIGKLGAEAGRSTKVPVRTE